MEPWVSKLQSAGAEEMLYGKPLETGEAIALRSSRLEVVILERGSVLEQPIVDGMRKG